MYNDTYISDFSEKKDYQQVLKDPGKLNILKTEYLNMYNGTSNIFYLAFKESLDHYVLKQILKDENYIKTPEFYNYIKYICDVANNKTTKIGQTGVTTLEYNTNVVFKDKKVRDLIFNTYFSDENKSRLNATIEKNNTRIEYCRDIFKNNRELTDTQLNFIAEYLHLSHDISSDLYKNYIEYVFNKLNKDYKITLPMASAILSYLPFIYNNDDNIKNSRMFIGGYDSEVLDFKNLHIDRIVYESKDSDTLESIAKKYGLDVRELCRLNPNAYKMYGTNGLVAQGRKVLIRNGDNIRFAHSKPNKKICAFEGELLKNVSLSDASLNYSRTSSNNDIYFWVMCSFHELTHQHQNRMMQKEEINTSGLAMIVRNTINNELGDYSRNHDSDEIEMEADENAWNNVITFIQEHINFSKMSTITEKKQRQGEKSYQLRCLDNRDSVHARRIFSQKSNNDKSLLLYYEYDLINLEKIVKKNPSLINRYPMLKKIFKSNGEINPAFVLEEKVTVDENNFKYRENYAGIEVATYLFTYKIKEIKNYLKNNLVSREQALNIKSNIYHTTHQNILKLRELDKINESAYKETNSQFDFKKIEELKKAYFKNIIIGIFRVVNINMLIGEKYPDLVEIDDIKSFAFGWFVEACRLCPNIDLITIQKYMNNYDKTNNPILLMLSNYAKKVYKLDTINITGDFGQARK